MPQPPRPPKPPKPPAPKQRDGTSAPSEPKQNVPVEQWTPHPVSDSADYLDGAPPSYAVSGGAGATADDDGTEVTGGTSGGS